MHSTIIRFTSSEYVDSYKKGELYLSSLSSFWNIRKGKIQYGKEPTPDEVKEILSGVHDSRQDFSEGVAAQVPRDKVAHLFNDNIGNHIIHDVRFRLNAYKYCNLLCFFRIDAEDGEYGYLDEDNAALILKRNGKNITADELKRTNTLEVKRLMESVIKKNHLLSGNKAHMIQLPDLSMDAFGDMVVVIKNEEEFKRRVLAAVRKCGGHCIMGDIRYHQLVDRVDPSTMNRHSVSLIATNSTPDSGNDWFEEDLKLKGAFDISLLEGIDGVYWRGCLDKYAIYGGQKEWRICWLPDIKDFEAKILSVGRLDDIIELVKTEAIREYLLDKYKGYIPGVIQNSRRSEFGTMRYKEFKEMMKGIDGTGEFVLDVGGG